MSIIVNLYLIGNSLKLLGYYDRIRNHFVRTFPIQHHFLKKNRVKVSMEQEVLQLYSNSTPFLTS